jgi:hypothetical protein
MGCSPDHPAVAGQVARGWAGPSRQVVPVLVGSDTSDEFPAGSENPPALGVGSVKHRPLSRRRSRCAAPQR